MLTLAHERCTTRTAVMAAADGSGLLFFLTTGEIEYVQQ